MNNTAICSEPYSSFMDCKYNMALLLQCIFLVQIHLQFDDYFGNCPF